MNDRTAATRTATTRKPKRTRLARWFALALTASAVSVGATVSAQDGGYQRISGEGSSWSANAIDAMRVNVTQFGITVDYNPSGSTAGRKNFLNGIVDFAASDIPFQFEPEDGSAPENPALGSYAYIPVTAGGTAFMYNLKINGKPVTNLRLSGENVSKIFTGGITMWNDPALATDNPGITLPARAIVPVVRSDGSGSTAQFTQWMIDRHPDVWNDYCNRSGRAPACGFTSFYPTIQGMIAQAGDLGVAGYVSQNFAEGAIGYVNYSYALGVQFPVAKVLNAAGYYTEPTPENVAVSLLQARINTDESDLTVYLTQQLDGVYEDTDPRSYQLSSYSYFILPTVVQGQFNEAKGRTLGAFAYYAMCQAQQQSASLGYSPLPINLVESSFDQIRRIPGVEVQNINIQSCNNPTFSPDGSNLLAENAPQPEACDRQGASQCPNGTGGLRNVPTAVVNPPAEPTGGATPQPNTGGPTGQPSTGGSGQGVTPDQAGTADPGDGQTATDTQTGQTGTGQVDSSTGQSGGPTGQASTGQPQVNQSGGSTTTTTTTTLPCAPVTSATDGSVPSSSAPPSSSTPTTSPATTAPTATTVASDAGTTTSTTLPPCPDNFATATTSVVLINDPGMNPVAAAVDDGNCDPDTGICGEDHSADAAAVGEQPSQAALGPISPVTLPQRPSHLALT
ncbi:MAG TPA: phosphate ABC transporter substrate-binding protein PstS, partial [Ilumatobacter sp.]|nr:phosphate ABC transporter substrate-binding protein PstS [Ilumatobacter sp.]